MTGSRAEKHAPVLEIGGTAILPGEKKQLDLPLAGLPTGTPLHLSTMVVRGTREGPRLWISAALHGDELNGIEIVRQILDMLDVTVLRGAVVLIPIVNVFGAIHQVRYLPDRRDLNRCFPGSPDGSLASRLAHLLMTEIVGHCTHGIDLHTGSQSRSNYPQIRANLDDAETMRCALAFGAPVLVHAGSRDGSLREAAARKGIPVLLYEAGEPLRFDARAIDVGVRGIRQVMQDLGMLRKRRTVRRSTSLVIRKSRWIRAPKAGIVRLAVEEGGRVARGQTIGVIRDPFGRTRATIKARETGVVIGMNHNPLVHMGDAVVHVGELQGEDA